MQTQGRFRDYFSFESMRDRNGELVCYHVTMIGTIEKDGVARIRTDMGVNNDQTMAFGRITIRGYDRKIQVLLKETNSRIYYHTYNPEEGASDIISFVAKDWRAQEVYNYNEGDRVLIEGRAYIRHSENPDYKDELSITVTGQFLLGRSRRRPVNDLVPQQEY